MIIAKAQRMSAPTDEERANGVYDQGAFLIEGGYIGVTVLLRDDGFLYDIAVMNDTLVISELFVPHCECSERVLNSGHCGCYFGEPKDAIEALGFLVDERDLWPEIKFNPCLCGECPLS